MYPLFHTVEMITSLEPLLLHIVIVIFVRATRPMPLADELEKPTPGNANHSVTPICDSHKTRTDIEGLLHLTVTTTPSCRSRVLLDGVSSVEIYELFLGVVKRDFLLNLT